MLTFGGVSAYLTNETNKKIEEANNVIDSTNKEIKVIQNDTNAVKEKTLAYTNRIAKIEQLTNQVVESNRYKKTIPVLLNRIMSVIPKGVKLTSIENTANGKIIITAEARDYDELGYFKAALKTKNILKNVTSDSSSKIDDIVKVTIEGDLP